MMLQIPIAFNLNLNLPVAAHEARLKDTMDNMYWVERSAAIIKKHKSTPNIIAEKIHQVNVDHLQARCDLAFSLEDLEWLNPVSSLLSRVC